MGQVEGVKGNQERGQERHPPSKELPGQEVHPHRACRAEENEGELGRYQEEGQAAQSGHVVQIQSGQMMQPVPLGHPSPQQELAGHPQSPSPHDGHPRGPYLEGVGEAPAPYGREEVERAVDPHRLVPGDERVEGQNAGQQGQNEKAQADELFPRYFMKSHSPMVHFQPHG